MKWLFYTPIFIKKKTYLDETLVEFIKPVFMMKYDLEKVIYQY